MCGTGRAMGTILSSITDAMCRTLSSPLHSMGSPSASISHPLHLQLDCLDGCLDDDLGRYVQLLLHRLACLLRGRRRASMLCLRASLLRVIGCRRLARLALVAMWEAAAVALSTSSSLPVTGAAIGVVVWVVSACWVL